MKKLLASALLGVSLIGLVGCSDGLEQESYEKTQESNKHGLARDVFVYSADGELLKEYSGNKVRIESENEGTSEASKLSILIDGKRMSFYNCTIVVEEK